jgi:uncharacterized protein (UPF0332 family)
VLLIVNKKGRNKMGKKKELIDKNAKDEALRYMQNALELLEKAGIEDSEHFLDKKYVRTACGTAYNGVLIAIDEYLQKKGIDKSKGRKSETYYRQQLGVVNRKMLNYYNDAYDILHLSGYYDGTKNKKVVNTGFECANKIIAMI